MKVVVTGGSGRLGQLVISELRAYDYDVLSLDMRPHPAGFVPHWTVDLAKAGAGAIYQALIGADVVVHLAAHRGPDLTDDCSTFSDNVAVTYAVLKAACDLKLQRAVLAGSHDVYGFRRSFVEQVPDYLPLDEAHPCRPTEPYALSKWAGESIADGFALRGLAITTLRFPAISYDPTFGTLRTRMENPGKWSSIFWTYVDGRDAATACRLCIESKTKFHRVFNLASPFSAVKEPTVQMIRRFFPSITDIRGDSDTNWSCLDSRRAEQELNFRAKYTL